MSMDYTFTDKEPVEGEKVKERIKWLCEIEDAKKEYAGWQKEAKDIEKLYKNGHKPRVTQERGHSYSDYNVVWMTYETAKEAIYGRTPNVIPTLRQGFETPVTKCAQLIAKRCLDFFIKNPEGSFDKNMRKARKDFMLLSQGQSWVYFKPENETEYEPITEDVELPEDTEVFTDEETGEDYYPEDILTSETAEVQYVKWEDYLQEPAASWEEVGWVAKRANLSQKEFGDTFGKDKLAKVRYGQAEESESERQNYRIEKDKMCEVWEIWSKEENKVIFVSEQYPNEPIDEQEPTCNFKGFFPCPEPLLGTVTNDSMVPVSDVGIMKYTINAIDSVTKRIGRLRQAIRVFGVCDAGIPELRELFSNDGNILKPVKNWSKYMESGKLAGVMDFFPIGEYITALAELNNERNRLKQDYYELSGYNSLMQGEAVVNESAEARQSRSRFTDLRLSARQKEMQRFCRDNISLLAEVIFTQFEEDTILDIASVSEKDNEFFTDEVQEEAVAFLRDNIARNMALEIETDSTLAINGEAEKQDRLEFMNAAINAINTAIGVGESLPEFMGPAVKMMKFSLQPFAAAQPLEISLEQAFDDYSARKAEEAEQEPPPDPVMLQMQQEQQQFEQKLQQDGMIAQGEIQMESQKNMMASQQKATDSQMKFQGRQYEQQFDYQKMQIDNQTRMMEFQQEMQRQFEENQGKLMLLREEFNLKMQLQAQEHQIDTQVKVQETQIDAQLKGQEVAIKAQSQAEKEMLDRQADLQKTMIETEAKKEEAIMNAQVELQKAAAPEMAPPPAPEAPSQPIVINNIVEKSSGKKVGKIGDKTVTIESVDDE